MTIVPASKGVLIGAGYFAKFHAEAWQRIPTADIVAVADSFPDKAQTIARQFGIPRAYTSVEEMIEREQPVFVDIVTRPESHLNLTRFAAARGIHVICQKPMAPSWEECTAMVDACEAAGVRLLMHENWRWQPWYREVRRVLAAGDLGRAMQFTFHWRTGDGRGPIPYAAQPYFREMPRLLVYESLVHILDTYRFLGGELASVSCRTRRVNPAIAGEDHALISLSFRDGALGLIDANRIAGLIPAPIAMGTFCVEGDRSQLRMSEDGRLWFTEYGATETSHDYPIPNRGYKGDSVWALQQHLMDALRSGQTSESDGRDYLATMRAVFACYRSAETFETVVLD